MFKRLLIGATGFLCATGGFYFSQVLVGGFLFLWPPEVAWAVIGLSAVLTGLAGIWLAPKIMASLIYFWNWWEARLHGLSTQDIISGVAGLVIALIIANLLGVSFYRLPAIGPYLPIGSSLVLGYIGWSIGLKRKDDFLNWVSNLPRLGGRERPPRLELKTSAKLLDTSVIIDGRIADILRSGFLEGTLIIPGFVLEELRHIADSSDVLKRNRGRRGLEILNRMRQQPDSNVRVLGEDFKDLAEVDSKLVRLAQVLGAAVLTNDFNLNKVAELQGVKVLNINELSNALKPVVLPGEELQVQVIKDGKEMGQGVGYLDDGTMIVVENGRRYIGQGIPVVVTSVLQTAAGRMIFARPKVAERRSATPQQAGLERGEYRWIT